MKCRVPIRQTCVGHCAHPSPSPLAQDYANGFLYGLEKLWAFHNYHGFPKDKELEIQPKVQSRKQGVGAVSAPRLGEGEGGAACRTACSPFTGEIMFCLACEVSRAAAWDVKSPC